jgi:hypothetical protein
MVKGRTRTVTVIEEAPSVVTMLEDWVEEAACTTLLRGRYVEAVSRPAFGKAWCWGCRELTMKG